MKNNGKAKKILFVFGTRPEAIKLAPVVFELKRQPKIFKVVVCVTAQHRSMLDQVLELFKIRPDYDLDIMRGGQDLFHITERTLAGLKAVLEKERPDMVLVQGDTTTAFVASLAAFYCRIGIGHVEAGLRSFDKYQPYPEEKNRQMVSVLADYHFAPTAAAKENLLKEGFEAKTIFVTGNTVIDALFTIIERQKTKAEREKTADYFKSRWSLDLENKNSKVVLVTGHRRENFGEGFRNICEALKAVAKKNPGAAIVYPVHLNPNVQEPARRILGCGGKTNKNIYLIDPLEYASFVYLMSRAYLILTDSGGIQEEAISLKKPILIMRAVTERPEGVAAGGAKLVGTDKKKIVSEAQKLLDDEKAYQAMVLENNPYGDGLAARRIGQIIGKELFK